MKKLALALVTMLLMPLFISGCQTSSSIYRHDDNWLALPDLVRNKKMADVFYLYPSYYTMPEGSEAVVASVDNLGMRQDAIISYMEHATLFENSCNIFAPYYIQLDDAVLREQSADVQEALMRSYPFASAVDAFDYYLKRYNQGRPFFLAGHGQGARTLLMLLESRFTENALQDRLVAAYLTGYTVTQKDLLDFPHLRFATGPDDVGVIVSYTTESASMNKLNPAVRSGALAINPISWNSYSTLATSRRHLGAVFYNPTLNSFTTVPSFSSAYIDARRSTLILPDIPTSKYVMTQPGYPSGSFAQWDVTFFYNNLKRNVEDRLKAYFLVHN